MIFVNLPVRDLPSARRFYAALGFSINDASSNERTAAVVLDDDVALMLRSRDRFAEQVAGDVGDPRTGTTVVHCLTVGSRDEVDGLVGKALSAGGAPWLPVREDASGVTGSFADPDGHVWEIAWMEPVHVID
ncbi:VOC family protein [Geodermatophilus marinus]|uniref:VOC family protein n=1 Tax=Geodermatophilus sp. LHW52908 TaxID=2303986 RepID=UPI001F449B35|nr:VOC family protein [Geodermatophilus sp. LHW52908]